MPQAVENAASLIEQLAARVRDLEQRVVALERQAQRTAPAIAVSRGIAPEPRTSGTWAKLSAADASRGVFPVVGRSILGFAGAFLLRALTESTSIPKLPVLIVAIVYACLWMVWAIRTYLANRFASLTYAITSALILCPLVWESTVRFQVLSPTIGALVLVAFLVLTMALANRQELQLTPWITTLSVVITAIALIIATRELVPLTAALLTVALATEANACVGHVMTFRAIPAIVADFSVWLTVYVLAAENVPEGYRPAAPATIIALCVMLPMIYGASIGIRSFVHRQSIGIFEIGQAAVSFALAAFGVMRASGNSAAPEVGVVFLLLAGTCYWGTLSRFADGPHARNRRVTANAAAAFLLAATFLLLPGNAQVPFLCFVALLATSVYTRTGKLSLGLHASFYIAAAVVVSPLPMYVANAAAANVPGAPEWRVWTVAVTAALCYVVGSPADAHQGQRRSLWVVPAAVVAFTSAGLVVAALVALLTSHTQLAPSHLSVIRTIVICALALVLAIASRWQRPELRWIAYSAVGFGSLKLVFEDLRFGNPASLVVSFLFYGLILILLPRLTRSAPLEKA